MKKRMNILLTILLSGSMALSGLALPMSAAAEELSDGSVLLADSFEEDLLLADGGTEFQSEELFAAAEEPGEVQDLLIPEEEILEEAWEGDENETGLMPIDALSSTPTPTLVPGDVQEPGGAEFDNSTTVPDGEYLAEDENVTFTFTGGTGKAKLDLVKVIVADGKATAEFKASSASFTHAYLGETEGNTEDTSLYDPAAGTTGTNVYVISEQSVTVPVKLNEESPIACRTTAMTEPHWVNYKYTISITEKEEPKTELAITNEYRMFKAESAYVQKIDGKDTLVFALSGSGYQKLIKGTYDQALAVKNNRDSWINGYENTDGKWEFKVALEEGEKVIPVVAVSKSKLEAADNGEGQVEQAFYPRLLKVDLEAKTLVTGDYEASEEYSVTNNVKMFKVEAVATITTHAGPNASDYSNTLTLTMGSESFDLAYVGEAAEAKEEGAAALTESSFAIAVPKEAMMEGAEFCVSFHSVKNQTWYERFFTIDSSAKTIVINPEAAPEKTELAITNNTGMFKAVTAYVQKIDGVDTLVFALSGTGYHYLISGNYEDALQVKENRDSWIQGALNAEEKWEFRIPLTEGVSYYPVVAVSQSYLDKADQGQNPVERAFYPRQLEIDLEAKTLVTDDYHEIVDVKIINNVEELKIAEDAKMSVVGGPNSNNYACAPVLQMLDDTYTIAAYKTAVSGKPEPEEALVDLSDDKTFTIALANQPNVISFEDKKPVSLSFMGEKPENVAFVRMTIDKQAKTITIDPATRSFITPDELAIPMGSTFQLTADPAEVIWRSSKENVATVSEDGLVTGVAPGYTAISAEGEDIDLPGISIVLIQFTDVTDTEKFYYDPVYWAMFNNITTGYKDKEGNLTGVFGVKDHCTREQIVTFLWRMAGEPEPAKIAAFSDMKEDAFYVKAVSWAAEKGITTGVSEDKFGVGEDCTRAMCVTFLWRMAGEPEPEGTGPEFTDVEAGKYYTKAVAWASEKGITTGYKDSAGNLTGKFGVKDPCERSQIVTFLLRYTEAKEGKE